MSMYIYHLDFALLYTNNWQIAVKNIVEPVLLHGNFERNWTKYKCIY